MLLYRLEQVIISLVEVEFLVMHSIKIIPVRTSIVKHFAIINLIDSYQLWRFVQIIMKFIYMKPLLGIDSSFYQRFFLIYNYFIAVNIIIHQHDLLVSSIDWSHITDKIVSCSHDRNAFVWTFDKDSKSWKPSLVILRIDKAAIDVKWSLDGLRFAVTSGAKCVPVCIYDSPSDW